MISEYLRLTHLRILREGVNDMRVRVRIGYAILLATYLTVELSVILGCPSFHKNRQIFPDPGSKLIFMNHMWLPASQSHS